MKTLFSLFVFIFGVAALQAETMKSPSGMDQPSGNVIQGSPAGKPSDSADEVEKMTKQAEELQNSASQQESEANKSTLNQDLYNKGKIPPSRHLGCLDLTLEEQTFSKNLSPSHQQVFCNQFNSAQRKMTINMVGMADANGKVITPDGAVEIVAKENQIDLPSETMMEQMQKIEPQSEPKP